ncbi:hyalin-like [Acanthaster planci]|uniref:Hyalin-like n=1 Tax=Acanthaster planci TaxID=133434 RepID=A0A8B7XHT9_ACAPL|nr:hyalin-like [Acanthaster planci]
MGTRSEDYSVDFSPSIHEFLDPRGSYGVRNFHRGPKALHANNRPKFRAGEPSAGFSWLLILAVVAVTVVILALIIGVPLAVIFGVVLPNSSTEPATQATTTVVTTTVTRAPTQPRPTVAPPRRVLQVLCPANINMGTDDGQAYAVSNWSLPTVLSPTGQVQMTSTAQPNSQFPIGTHSVQYTVTDAANNRGTCSFLVTVFDDDPPSIQCPPNMTVPTDQGSRSARVNFTLPIVTENSNIPVTWYMTDRPGDHFLIGRHPVTFVVQDGANNEGRCTFIICVEDREGPRVTCPGDITAFTNSPLGSAQATWPLPTAFDNSLTSTQSMCFPASGSLFLYGLTSVNCSASDIAGNSGTCMFKVNIQFNDTQPPVFAGCPGDIQQNATMNMSSAVVTWVSPTTSDNSLEPPTVTSNIQANTSLLIGTYVVMYTAEDAVGNVATCKFTVEVIDVEDPVITCPADFSNNTNDGQAYAIVSLPAPTTSDNSVTNLTVTTNPCGPSPTLNIGNNVVVYTVRDNSGNIASCNTTVMILDNEPPKIMCRSVYTVRADQGQSFGNVSLPPPELLIDNSGGDIGVTTSPANNSMLDIGMNSVVYTATDPSGNMASCNLSVSVVDFETPDLSCPDDVNTTTDARMPTARVNFTATVIDNSGISAVASDYPSGSAFPIGDTLVTFNATDTAGNRATCNFTITVRDEEDPEITCPAHLSPNTDSGRATATVDLPNAVTTDNSMTNLSVTTDPSGSLTLNIGIHTVTYTVTDESGNSASCNITVTVRDVEPPTALPPPNFEIPTDPGKAYATVSLPLPTNVIDNSGGEVTITTSQANNSILDIGPIQVTYNVTDPYGNNYTFTIVITVVDEDPPVLICPDDNITFTDAGQAFATVTFDPRNLTDNDRNMPNLTADPTGNMFNIGSTNVTLTARDRSGNMKNCTFTITVQDNEDPDISCPASFNQSADKGQANTTVIFPSATASDNSMTVTVTSVPSGSATLSIGRHTVIYTAMDDSRNAALCNLTVTVVDMELPTATPPPNFETLTDPGKPSAVVSLPLPTNVMDNSEGEVNITTSPANNSVLDIGTNKVTYMLTDPSGNTLTFNISVVVRDEEPPVLTCPEDNVTSTDLGEAFANVTFQPKNLTDNDGKIPSLMSNFSGNLFSIGSTIVTLIAEDGAGNMNNCTFTITVRDIEDPDIMCPANFNRSADRGRANTTVILPNATASDNSMESVTVTSVLSGAVILGIGNHMVTYAATDTSNNTAMCNLTVTITDMELPTLTPPLDFEVLTDPGKPNAIVSLPLPTNIMDNSGGEVNITTSPVNNSMLDIGTNEVMYMATDSSGNTVMFSINVTVIDEEPPVLICPNDNVTSTDAGEIFATITLQPRNLTDNDGNRPTLMSNASSNMFNIGLTIITLTAEDGSGNTNNCTFTITVQDDVPPTLECPSEVIVYSNHLSIPLQFSGVATWTVNVSDNSRLPLMRNDSTHQSGSVFNVSSTTVTHTAVDAFNNSQQCSFNVTVVGFQNTLCTSSTSLNLTELSGTGVGYFVLSPSYDVGLPYPNMQECILRVSAPSGSHVRMRFITFDTELSDLLTVGSGLDETDRTTSLAVYSGMLPAITNGSNHAKDRVFDGDSIWLNFTSDVSTPKPASGFLLQLYSTTNPRDLYPDSYSFCAEFDGFPCLNGTCVNISKRCDGSNDCLSGEDEVNCPPSCQMELTENVGFTLDGVSHIDIVSVNYPGEYRPCNASWNIDSTSVVSLRLVVMDIQLGAGDRLYAINQATGSQVTPDIDSPISLHLTNGTRFALVFVSGGGVGRGFWVRVWRYTSAGSSFDFPAYCELALHGVQCGEDQCLQGRTRCNRYKDCAANNDEHMCGQTADCGNTIISLGGPGSTYTLTSFNYPADYVTGINCQYMVTTSAAKIRVSFRDVEIDVGTTDYLHIGNGDTVSDATELLCLNNFFLPADLVSDGNQLWIQFMSDGFINRRGFWIELVAE